MKNNLILLIFLFLLGCGHSESQTNESYTLVPSDLDIRVPPPPSFTPNLYKIQINSVPMPFHLAHCYIVWVNGKRIALNSSQIIELAQSLNLSTDPPIDTKDLHDGKGWHQPLEIVEY